MAEKKNERKAVRMTQAGAMKVVEIIRAKRAAGEINGAVTLAELGAIAAQIVPGYKLCRERAEAFAEHAGVAIVSSRAKAEPQNLDLAIGAVRAVASLSADVADIANILLARSGRLNPNEIEALRNVITNARNQRYFK